MESNLSNHQPSGQSGGTSPTPFCKGNNILASAGQKLETEPHTEYCLRSLFIFGLEAAFFVLAINDLKNSATAIKDFGGAAGKKHGMQMMHQLFDKIVGHSAVLPSASDFNLEIRILQKRL